MRVVALCGSLRAASFNRRLLREATAFLAARAEVEPLELKDLPMPIYDGDLEASSGLPEAAVRLRDRIAAADALAIASPEYNNSIPGGLKNAIDWVSRAREQPFRGKPVLLLGASPGAFGAVRGQMALRQALTPLAPIVLPIGVTLPHADQAFDDDGHLKDAKVRATVERACNELLRFAAAFKAQA